MQAAIMPVRRTIALRVCALVLLAFAIAFRIQPNAPEETVDAARNVAGAQDTLRAHGLDVVTLRFDGLTIARVDIVPLNGARLNCRALAPDGGVMQVVRSARVCSMQWLAPRTGAYRIEVANRSGSAVPYLVERP